MLRVGARQIAALRGAATARFADQVIARLRLDLPRQFGAMAQDQARAKALAATRKAQHFGVSTEQEVFRFVALTFVFGDDFLRRDWAVPILKDPSLTRPSERLAVLWEGAPPIAARA